MRDRQAILQELLGDMLCERPEVADLSIRDDCFDVDYYLDFCPNCQPEQPEEPLTPAPEMKL